ncbi:hypothetical protein PHPALM_7863 [Phytophthora palmivora]|uniref:Uncharacterized protein n=1 Tax=Phytophthora palmivora TaxID=4796 RepID=A0A2P4YBC0_9STRA|nr:hypothetical protein PHPALM_7863 [Phytophthora palmivora]
MKTRIGRMVAEHHHFNNNDEASTDNLTMTTVPMTSLAIVPLWVTNISHSSLVRWKKQRREYVDAIITWCTITGEDADVSNVKNGDIGNVDSLLESELTMDLRESDVQDRVLELQPRSNIMFVLRVILDPHWLDANDNCNLRRGQPLVVTLPTALHDEVVIQQKLIDNSSTKNDAALYKLVKETALEQDKAFRSLTNRKQQQVVTMCL